ncbi:hypothetical protein CPB84DRAFT_188476 [Gymnopilus junonius]|uniref:Uncharacterized protein n=1 Tax=Gymnopilus junonius TaxID=109634 RepID=A0A9P5NHC2_GYMJU|nr:hypothetical protein CPB84DRAFT_188476 [Gymnopilus junonius]
MAPPGKKEVDNRAFVPSLRSLLYAIGFSLIFMFTCIELGFVSQQIHKYGRWSWNYASLEYRNSLGLLLTAVIVSLLVAIFHFWLPLGMTTLLTLILAVFFGTGGGIIRTVTPFRGTSCRTKRVDEYPPKWQPFAHECSRVIVIEAFAWALFALYTFMFFGSLIYLGIIRFSLRPTRGGYYASPNRTV